MRPVRRIALLAALLLASAALVLLLVVDPASALAMSGLRAGIAGAAGHAVGGDAVLPAMAAAAQGRRSQR